MLTPNSPSSNRMSIEGMIFNLVRSSDPVEIRLEDRDVVAQWLTTHPALVAASPALQNLANRLLPADKTTPIHTRLTHRLTAAAKRVIHKITQQYDETTIEKLIRKNDVATLSSYFADRPAEIFTHASLLKTHLEIGTLKFDDFLIIIGAAAEATLAENTASKDPFSSSLPSFFATFEKELTQNDRIEKALRPDGYISVKDILNAVTNLAKQHEQVTLNSKYEILAKLIDGMPLHRCKQFLSADDFLRIAPYLQNIDLIGFKDISLGQQMIANCKSLMELSIDDSLYIKDIQSVVNCRVVRFGNCTGLNVIPTLPLCTKAVFENCPNLTQVGDLPLCTFAVFTDCPNLIQVGNLQSCKEAFFSSCTGLTQVGDLPSCTSALFRDCQSLTQVGDLPRCIYVKFLNCASLTRVGDLSSCTQVEFNQCTRFSRISNLPLCTEASFYFCPGLTRVGDLPLCTTAHFNYCPSLIQVGDLRSCVSADFTGCTSLIQVSALPSCRRANFSGCRSLRDLPEIPSQANVITQRETGDPTLQFASLNVDVEDFSKNPLKLLNALGDFFLQKKFFPNIYYFENGQRTDVVDIGGVRRDFVTRLCESIFRQQTRLPETNTHLQLNGREPYATSDQMKAYKTLGCLLALCYLQSNSFKTGPLFDEKLYELITTAGDPGPDNAPPPDKWMLKSYWLLKDLPEEGMDILDPSKPLPRAEILQLLACLLPEMPNNLTEYFNQPNARSDFKRMVLDEAKDNPYLRAIGWMAQMMKARLDRSDWLTLRIEGAERLREKVEGVLDARSLIAHLEWLPQQNVTSSQTGQIKAYLETWIRNHTQKDLETFVRAVSSNRTLPSEKLKMEIYDREPGRLPAAHTCFFSLELTATVPSQDEFDSKLDLFLSESLAGTGFSFA